MEFLKTNKNEKKNYEVLKIIIKKQAIYQYFQLCNLSLKVFLLHH